MYAPDKNVLESFTHDPAGSAAVASMIAEAAHDMRVSMNTIYGYVLLLLKNSSDPEQVEEYAHRIGLSCQELLTIVDQAEDLVVGTDNDAAPAKQEFAMSDLLTDVDRMIRPLAETERIHFNVLTTGLEHDIFLGDRGKLGRILINLLSGGIRHTGEGGRVTLRVLADTETDPHQTFLSFEIEDTGEGFGPEELKRLLGAVESDNGKAVSASGWNGVSMKLAATRKLAQQIGATISVQSRKDIGTTFIVSLRMPRVNEVEEDIWNRCGVKKVLFAGRSRMEGARIAALLTGAGLEARYVPAGKSIRQMLEEGAAMGQPYDLVLVDERLEDMTGEEALRYLRDLNHERNGDLFGRMILLYSVGEEPDEKTRRMADALMPRPFYLSMLKGLLEEMLPLSGQDKERTDSGEDAELTNPLQGMRILVAEDNALNADIAKELLELEGARCEIAGNGMAAVAMFRNSRPAYYDMILMDIQMPVMDGFQATRTIRRLPREDAENLSIIAMTGSILSEDIKRALEAGMNAHIAKPIDIRLLTDTIRRLRQKNKT